MDMGQEFNQIDENEMNKTDDNVAILPIELMNITSTKLQHLNEDCLLEIFSSKTLTLLDLCSLADTCKRFKPIVQRIFPKRFGRVFGIKFYYDSSLRLKSQNYVDNYRTVMDVERILRNFGTHLSTLSIRGNKDETQAVVNTVAKCCGSITLKRLKICGMDSVDGLRVEFKSIFQRLLKLSIYNCNFVNASARPIKCDSLVELEIQASNNCVAILENTFPNLKRFTFIDSRILDLDSPSDLTDNNVVLVKFIRSHNHLRTINMGGFHGYFNNELMYSVGNSCEQLEELTINNFDCEKLQISLEHAKLKRLTNLRKLVIAKSANFDQCVAIVQASKSLETVILDGPIQVPFHFFGALSQLPNLRELHLPLFVGRFYSPVPWAMLTQVKKMFLKKVCIGHDHDIVDIIRHMANLEELELANFVQINDEDLSKIVKIVEQRPHILKLKYKGVNFPAGYDETKNVKLIINN